MILAPQVRIDFTELNSGRVIIDGRPLESPPGGPPEPFSIRAVLPGSLWGAAAAAVLDDWARHSTVVHARLRAGRDSRQVILGDGRFVMLLDLDGDTGAREAGPLQALLLQAGSVGR